MTNFDPPELSNKRQRIAPTEGTKNGQSALSTTSHSHILAPFRSLGHITSPNVPFASYSLGTGTFQITTSVGNSLQTYDIRHLSLVFVTTPCTPSPIKRLVAAKDLVVAAFGGSQSDPEHGVWIFKRGKKVGELEAPTGGWRFDWKDFIVFGDWGVGAFGNGDLVVWKLRTREVHTEIVAGKRGEAVGLVHPQTHLNKVVVARTGGNLEIWNVKTGKLIFNCPSPISGAVTTIVQCPVLDHVALGTSDSRIHLHNILTDTPLFTLAPKIQSTKKITSLSFCTDPSVGAGISTEAKPTLQKSGRILAAGDDEGDVTLWDLQTRRVVGIMRNVHRTVGGGVTKCEFLNGQKVMVTAGGDNSLKEWIFDSPHTILPRVLRQRSGHSAPPTTLTFYEPSESHFLLSSSQDRTLWGISLRRDEQAFELSQSSASASRKRKKYNLREFIEDTKAPPITAIAVSDSEGAKREWENIITAHRGEKAARTWHWEMKRLGRWVFPTGDEGEVKSVGVSACGNFGFVGSSKGGVDMWNLQSGIKRNTFPKKLPANRNRSAAADAQPKVSYKHQGAVTGIVTDATNRWIATSGLDGKIKFWDLMGGSLIHEIELEGSTAITAARLYRGNDLLAISCDDLCIRIIDTETKKIVRELWGCGGRITDMCFSHDGRWIIAASLDSIIRIWDLPTGNLIDGVRCRSIVTALAWSGKGEYLVTGHVDDVGVNLWTNRTLFTRAPTRRLKEEEIVEISMPTSSGKGGTGILEGALEKLSVDSSAMDEDHSGIYVSKAQLSEELLTTSLVPKTRWQTLLHLDIIRKRNKPKEAPKKPEKTPFFLGALPSFKNGTSNLLPASASVSLPASAEAQKATEAETEARIEAERSRILRLSLAKHGSMESNGDESIAMKLLRQGSKSKDFTPFIEHFKTLSPALVDLEIRGLHTPFKDHLFDEVENQEAEEPLDELSTFIDALTFQLIKNQDYELLSAWMNIVLKVHGSTIVEILSVLHEMDGIKGTLLGKGLLGEEVTGSVSIRKKRRGERLDTTLRRWNREQERESRRIAELVGYCSGVVGFLRSGR